MKRAIVLIVALIMLACLLYACQKESLPVQEYPLDAETIETALEEWGFDCIVEEELLPIETHPNRTFFNLNSAKDGSNIGAILSGRRENGERHFNLTFVPSGYAKRAPLENCEEALAFASSLFGGFESMHQLHDLFMKEYDMLHTTRVEEQIWNKEAVGYVDGEMAYWENEVGNVACLIRVERPVLTDPKEYVQSITLVSD